MQIIVCILHFTFYLLHSVMADDYREEEIIVPLRCPNCGGLNPPENKVCQLCSYKLTGATPASPPGVQLTETASPLDRPAAPATVPPTMPVSSESSPLTPPAPPSYTSTSQSPASASSARGGSALAARLGGGGGAQSPADWLGDLRRTMGGEAPPEAEQTAPPPHQSSFAPPPPPTNPPPAPTPDEQVGYILPSNPGASPYRREEQSRASNEPVDWMASLRASSSFTPPTAEVEEEPEAEQGAVPDWLRNLRTGSEPRAGELAAEEEEPGDVPPWLSEELGPDTGPIDRIVPPDTGPMDRTALPEAHADLPPWLREGTDTLDPARVSDYETRQSSTAATSIPPWLQQPPEPVEPAAERPADFSDWFSNRVTTAPPTPAAPPPAPAPASSSFFEDSDAPAWLREVAAAPPPPMPRAMAEPEPATPEVVAAEATPEATQAANEAEVAAAPPAWLQPDVSSDGAEEEAPTQAAATEGLAGDEAEVAAPSAGATEATAVAEAATPIVSEEAEPRRVTTGGLVSPEDLPPWLRMVGGEGDTSPGGNGASATPAAAPAASAATGASRFFPATAGAESQDSTVPAWLRGFGGEGEDVTPANAEALTAPVAEPSQRIQRVMAVRPARPGAAEALAALVAAPSASTRTAPIELKEERGKGTALMNWLLSERGIYLLVAIVMFVVVFADVRLGLGQPLYVAAPPPSTQVDSFYNAINKLPANSAVLVAYDWDANRQAEMLPLAEALTCHLAAVDARFATVSLVPAGPAFAQQVAAATIDRASPCSKRRYNYGSDYVNLGYSTGGDFALRSMVGSIATVFNQDYVNGNDLFGANGSAALKGVTSLSDFKLIIVLEGDESTARSWIEQVASQPSTPPLLLGTSAALDPSLQPYLANAAPTRFQGKVAGLADVARYQYDLTAKSITMVQNNLASSLNFLSFAHLLVALLIILGNIVFLTRLVNNRK